MKLFREFTYQDAVAAIAAHKAEHAGDAYETNRLMAEEHDFWQDGKTWVGPRGSDEVWAARIKGAVEKQFIPGGAVLRALRTFAQDLFGEQANIQAASRTPVEAGSETERKLNAEGEELIAALSAWWDKVGLWGLARLVGRRARWAGWGTLRLRIPGGRLVKATDAAGREVYRLPSFRTFEEALSVLELYAHEPDHCVALTHPDTQQRGAIFHYAERVDGVERKRVELWYEQDGKTELRVLGDDGKDADPIAYEWGGRLPVAEMEGDLMLTEPVRRAEAALGFAATNVVRVGETAGFRERYAINAEPPGEWLTTPPPGPGPHETTEDGKFYLHPIPRALGAGVTTDLVGIPIESDQGGEKRATPSMVIADPVDPDYATKVVEFWDATVLDRCGQGHRAMSARGEASGYAYEQARAEYASDLQAHVDPAERAIAGILEAAVAMAESMTANPRRWLERHRLIVTITPDPGPVSAEYRAQIMAEVKAGLRSRQSAMALIGIDDVAAELDAIAQDPASQLGLLKERIGLILELKSAEPDLSLVQAAIIVGIEPEEAREMFGEADTAAAQGRQARDEIKDALEKGRAEPAREVA